MSTYAISFNLLYGNDGDSYSERYASLMAAIRKCPKVWDETTSFAVVETSETITDLERRLWLSKFDSTKDILFVVDITYKDCTIRGATKNRSKLKEILPHIQEK